MKHFWMLEVIYTALSTKTRNDDIDFFKIIGAYQLTKCASLMNTYVEADGYGKHAVNFYGINLAGSGFGKGFAKRVIEHQVEHKFKRRYIEFTQPAILESNLRDLANKRSALSQTCPDEEYEKVVKEYNTKTNNTVVYDFRKGTPEGAQQYREGILMAGIGSLNFEVDEIGSNLLGNKDMIDLYLELYDGKIGQKLIKNTNDNKRSRNIDGITHTNMLMFGEPIALLDGGSNEAAFDGMQSTGYARRCFCGYSANRRKVVKMTPQERLAMLKDKSTDTELNKVATQLEKLADSVNYNITVKVPEDTLLLLAEYELYCQQYALTLRPNQDIEFKEAEGRYFKTMRLAGAYAWLDGKNEMSVEHLEAAIKLAEESASALNRILNRDPVHARLAKHLVEIGTEATHAELMDDLRYYPKSSQPQKDLLRNTIAWGHRNNIIVKRKVVDEIEFIQAEALQPTDLDNIKLSFSNHFAENYKPRADIKFFELHKLTQTALNWCSHHFIDMHRASHNAIQGFNLICIDVDEGINLASAQSLLSDYTYHIYTTKSHRVINDKNPNGLDRFRIVFPMSHTLKMDATTYKEFMKNVHEFLPFPADTQTGEIARKWESFSGEYHYNSGQLFDVLPLIPKTKKNEERIKAAKDIADCDGIERWFLTKISEDGDRNNHFQRYGYMLIDGGYDVVTAQTKVAQLNSLLPKPMSEKELFRTVYASMGKHAQRKGR